MFLEQLDWVELDLVAVGVAGDAVQFTAGKVIASDAMFVNANKFGRSTAYTIY